MTPRQLHALEWAVREAERELQILFKGFWQGSATKGKIDAANKALAAGWRDYRASRIDARTGAPRRALQRVKLDRPA